MRGKFIRRYFSRAVLRFRSACLSRLVDEGPGRVILQARGLAFGIQKEPGARLVLNGDLRIIPHLGGNESSCISLGQSAVLHLDGDFSVGNGVRIRVDNGATLRIGGRSQESDSGITSNSTILVQRSVTIGQDFLCAWGVLITDSDWHHIEGQSAQSDVVIGDRVWIAHGASVLKGTHLGSGSILAAHSLVSRTTIPPQSLVAGIPGRVIRTGVKWSRDLPR